MSLTLFLIVMSIGIAYLIYQTFKKSRPANGKPPQKLNSNLQVIYEKECSILNSLQKSKKQGIKARTISINLLGDQYDPSLEQLHKLRDVLTELAKSRRIYLLEKTDQKITKVFAILKQVVGRQFTIPYQSIQGGVAVIRQLAAGMHLQSNPEIYSKIKQYLRKMWLVGTDETQQALRQFKTEIQMLLFLDKMQKIEE